MSNIFPLITIAQDDKDISIFHNMNELNNGTIEPEDVISELYVVYDTQGNLFKLSTNMEQKVKRKFLFLFEYTDYLLSREIFIDQISYNNEYEEELRDHLLHYFKVYQKTELQPSTPLSDLIKKLFLVSA